MSSKVRSGFGEIIFNKKLWFLAIFLILLLFLRTPLSAQVAFNQFAVTLKSGILLPPMGIEENIFTELNTLITQEKIPRIIIQFKKTPSRIERANLSYRGITLISYIGGNAWYALLSNEIPLSFTDPKITDQYPVLKLIRWIGNIKPEDKIHPFIKTKGPGSWAINPDGTIKVSIDFFRDTTSQEAKEVLAKYGVQIETEKTRRPSFHIIIDPDKLDLLSAEDKVKLIDFYPPPKTIDNNGSRVWTNTDTVHTEIMESDPTINIEGNGVILGIWDANEVYSAHTDLGGVIFGETPRTWTSHWHSTHVAGTMAGDGTTTFNLRGHAPNAAQIVSYDYDHDVPAEMEEAIDIYNIVAANNSWGSRVGWYDPSDWHFVDNQFLFGEYTFDCPDLDDIVRVENLIIVFSSGNDRDDPDDGSETAAQPGDWDQGTGNNGYDTLPPPKSAKNIITVGAIDDATNLMADFSSWGPTDDGRIKPDVVAPGVSIGSCYNDNPTSYAWASGTSAAAPAVTGIAGLLVQTYRDEFFEDVDSPEVPLPSTIKALLINSADDLGNPGPDFSFGWGGVNAEGAYDIIRERRVMESQLSDTGDENVFLCIVPLGETRFAVTICWDDWSGPNLVNDLDLSLEAPDGTTIFRPWILDPSAGNWANNATRGADLDHTNNCEQVFVDNPDSGIWKIRVHGFAINEPAANPVQKYSLVSDFPFYMQDSVSVVQVIDRSGSMDHIDALGAPTYMESAKIAAQNFIGLMHLGDEIGVVAFDDQDCDNAGLKADDIFPLDEIETDVIRQNAMDSIDPITDRGCTSIGAGMEMARTFLTTDATPDNPHAMVLLTDGYENTPPWVREKPTDLSFFFSGYPETPNNILLTIPEQTDIYTIALGPHSDTDLMKDIANTTGGKFYESPTILGLLSIYYQIQGDLELGDMADLETGTKGGGNDTRIVTIDPGASEATFVVGWLQPEGDLELTIYDPNYKQVNEADLNVDSGGYDTYHFVRIRNPMPGNWEVHITREDSGTFQIDYTFAAFVKGVSKSWAFTPEFVSAGDYLLTKVHLYDTHTLKPIYGATVKAIITTPQVSKYTLYYNYVRPKDYTWKPASIMLSKSSSYTSANLSVSEDLIPYSSKPTWNAALRAYDQENIQETGNSIFQYDKEEFTLVDDGTHGDEQIDDGIYTHCIDKTQIAGSYNIRFSISGVNENGAPFKRQILSTAVIKPGIIDISKSLVRVIPSFIDGTKGEKGIITIVPRDSFGNVLGPKNAAKINVLTTAGKLVGDIIDNGDGFYFQTIKPYRITNTGRIIVTINKMTMPTVTFNYKPPKNDPWPLPFQPFNPVIDIMTGQKFWNPPFFSCRAYNYYDLWGYSYLSYSPWNEFYQGLNTVYPKYSWYTNINYNNYNLWNPYFTTYNMYNYNITNEDYYLKSPFASINDQVFY